MCVGSVVFGRVLVSTRAAALDVDVVTYPVGT